MTARPCAICAKRLPQTPAVCEPCRARLLRHLAQLPTLYANATAELAAATSSDHTTRSGDPVNNALPAGPVPGAATGPHVSGSHTPPIPSLPGTHIAEAAYSVTSAAEATLDHWATKWRHERASDEPVRRGGVPETVAWLTTHLDWACDHSPTITQFATELAQLATALRRADGERRQLIGYCPTEHCGAELHAQPHATTTECPDCGTNWPRRHWLWLSDTLRTAA